MKKLSIRLSSLLLIVTLFASPFIQTLGAAIQYSYAGQLGQALQHIFAPIGFNWQISIALVPGLAAREVAVGALGKEVQHVAALTAVAAEQIRKTREQAKAQLQQEGKDINRNNTLSNLVLASGSLLLNDRIIATGRTVSNTGANLSLSTNISITGAFSQRRTNSARRRIYSYTRTADFFPGNFMI